MATDGYGKSSGMWSYCLYSSMPHSISVPDFEAMVIQDIVVHCRHTFYQIFLCIIVCEFITNVLRMTKCNRSCSLEQEDPYV